MSGKEPKPAGARRASRRVRKGGALVSEHRLQNGLRVLVAERRGDPVVAVMTFYRVGSRNEREHEAGVSHFLEHMMFKGSLRFAKGEVDRRTTELGGSNNAFTGNDHTAYWFELASDRWEAALEIEADRMRHLALEPEEFRSEREVVLEELAMGEDEPWRVLGRRVEEMLFGRHPYGRPVIGTAAALRALEVADMRAYYDRFYHPANATLVVAGDVTPTAALRAVRRHFAALEPGPGFEEVDPWRPEVEEPAGERRLAMSWDDEGKRLCIAWPGTSVGSDDDFRLDVVSTSLSGSRLATLQRRLVFGEGLATSVATSNDARVEGGVFWLFAECAQGVEPGALEAAIDEELESLRTRNVAARRLARAKDLIRTTEAFGSETVSDVAEELGEFAVDADWRLALDGRTRYERIGAREVRECAARLLVPERRVVGWCLPRAERANGRAAVR